MLSNKKSRFLSSLKKKQLPVLLTEPALNDNSSLNLMQKDIINTITKRNLNNLKKRGKKLENFDEYVSKIELSLNNYQLTSSPLAISNITTNPNDKYLNKKDKIAIQKIYELNKSFSSQGLASQNEDHNLKISVGEMDYPNPYHSLGIIKHNHQIYNNISKDFLSRQKDLFDISINEAESYQMKYKVKMPKIHVSGSIQKNNFDIPIVDMTEKKKDFNSLPLIPATKSESLRLFSYFKYPNKNFPEGREQFSICMKGNEILISGGFSSNLGNLAIWTLNIEKLEWRKIKQKSISDNRYGHTAISFQNKLFIFGGKARYSGNTVCCGLEIFSFYDGTYSVPPLGKYYPAARRNHVAALVGSQMLIYGGLTDDNKILNDCYLLNLITLKWTICNINKYAPGPMLYGHTCALVIPGDMAVSHKFSIYSFPNLDILKSGSKIKEKGLYVFGGKMTETKLSDQLWILVMGNRQLDWVRPETKGIPPSPRYFHSMSFYEKGNFLIIHGGRNDEMSENCGLNDTFIFDLENFEWMKIELYSQGQDFKVLNRYGHQSMPYGNKLIIFGGMNNNNYLGSSLFIVNLDFYYSTLIETPEQLMLKQLEERQKTDPEARRKMIKLKSELTKNNPLGIVTAINLPSIK